MTIICEHCGQKSTKFASIKFDPKWLRAYLEAYFEKDLTFQNNIRVKNDIRIRRIAIYIFKNFTYYKFKDIAKEFCTNAGHVCDNLHAIDLFDEDLREIVKQLTGQLPEIIENELEYE